MPRSLRLPALLFLALLPAGGLWFWPVPPEPTLREDPRSITTFLQPADFLCIFPVSVQEEHDPGLIYLRDGRVLQGIDSPGSHGMRSPLSATSDMLAYSAACGTFLIRAGQVYCEPIGPMYLQKAWSRHQTHLLDQFEENFADLGGDKLTMGWGWKRMEDLWDEESARVLRLVLAGKHTAPDIKERVLALKRAGAEFQRQQDAIFGRMLFHPIEGQPYSSISLHWVVQSAHTSRYLALSLLPYTEHAANFNEPPGSWEQESRTKASAEPAGR